MSFNPFSPMLDRQAHLRALLYGPAGSGKTTTAVLVALGMAPEARVCLVDSERGSAAKAGRDIGARIMHADVDAFARAVSAGKGEPPLVEHDPRIYAYALSFAAQRYDVVIVDGLTPAWDACMALVDLAAPKVGGNSHKAWAAVTPLWRGLLDAVLSARAHVICTARAKTVWADERNERGKMVPRAVGMQPVLRDGAEYEFDLVMRLEADHSAVVTKARSALYDGQTYASPGRDMGASLALWLSGATPDAPAQAPALPTPERPLEAAPPAPSSEAPALLKRAVARLRELGLDPAADDGASASAWLASMGRTLPAPGDAEGLAGLLRLLDTGAARDMVDRWMLATQHVGCGMALTRRLAEEGFEATLCRRVVRLGIGAPMEPTDPEKACAWWRWWDEKGRDKYNERMSNIHEMEDDQ